MLTFYGIIYFLIFTNSSVFGAFTYEEVSNPSVIEPYTIENNNNNNGETLTDYDMVYDADEDEDGYEPNGDFEARRWGGDAIDKRRWGGESIEKKQIDSSLYSRLRALDQIVPLKTRRSEITGVLNVLNTILKHKQQSDLVEQIYPLMRSRTRYVTISRDELRKLLEMQAKAQRF